MPEEKVTEEYAVYKREVWVQRFNVQASSLEEAIRKAENDEGEVDEETCLEYSHTLDLSLWTVQAPDGTEYRFNDQHQRWKKF
jgi:hypothetical protein